jgi:hypothetical protein
MNKHQNIINTCGNILVVRKTGWEKKLGMGKKVQSSLRTHLFPRRES